MEPSVSVISAASVEPPYNKITKIVVLSSIIASLGGILFGYDIGIISSANLQLRHKFDLSCLMQEVVVSCVLLGAFLGSLAAGSVVDYFGRRRSILGTSLLFILGAVLLALSQNLAMLLTGRLLVGFGVALSTAAECTYISEISPPRWRGMLVSLNELGITLGFLLAFLVGHFFIHNSEGWRYMFGLAAIPAVVQLFGITCLPPSPYFLVLQGKPIHAQEIVKKIHPGMDPQTTVAEITSAVVEAKMTGNTNVLYYAPIIFQQFGYCSDSASTLATVGLGGVKVVTAAVALVMVDRAGRRPLLVWGSALMAVSVALLGVVTVISGVVPPSNDCSGDEAEIGGGAGHLSSGAYSLLDLSQSNFPLDFGNASAQDSPLTMVNGSSPVACGSTSGSGWIRGVSLASLMVFISAYQFSFGIGTWLVLSEIFPTKVRGRSISICTSVYWATSVILSATFLNTIEAMGVGYTMIMYGVVCFLSALLIYLFVPETKQKTLEEITAELSKGLRCHCTCLPPSGAAIIAGNERGEFWLDGRKASPPSTPGATSDIYRGMPD